MTAQTVKVARWYLDLFLDGSTVRIWNGVGDSNFAGVTYTGLQDRFRPPERIKRSAGLKAETFTITLDGSRQTDNSDVIGAILDQRWRKRRARLRQVLTDPGNSPNTGTVLVDEYGRISELVATDQDGEPSEITLDLESGSLTYLERRMQTRSPENQKASFPGDLGFDLAPQLIDAKLPWRTKENKAGAVELAVQSPDEPAPRQMLFGRWASKGSFVFADTNGQERKYWQRVYALADHRIERLDRLWIDGEPITIPSLTHGVKTEIPHFRSSEPRAWITFYDGREDQVADAYLTGAASAWTSAHRLRGVAYVILEFLWDSDNPQNPEPRFGGLGGRWYDRREDTTAGGSGSQRLDQPSTWTYSANPAVIADHYRLGIVNQAGSGAPIWFGMGEPVDVVPYSEFADLADHCDESVALKAGGTQTRYEAHGSLSAADSHADNLQALADCFAGRAIDQGGRVVLRALRTRPVVMTLTDGDLRRGERASFMPDGNIDNLANTVEGRFTDPAQEFRRVDYPAATNAAYITEDGEQIAETFDQPREISGERAQRKAALRLADRRRQVMLEEVFLSKAQPLAAGDWFNRTSTLRGFTDKTFEVEEIERRADGGVKITALEVDPTQLIWDEQTAVDLSVPPAFPQLTLPGLSVPDFTLVGLEEISGDNITPAIRLDMTVAEFPEQFEIQFALKDASATAPADGTRITKAIIDGEQQSTLFVGFMPSTEYVFRARGLRNGRRSAWSAWKNTVTLSRSTATTALAVEWSGVTGAGRPEDNADVTGSNIAAGFSGQDWGATASQADADNAVVRAEDQRHNLMDPRYELFRRDLRDSGQVPFFLTNATPVGTQVNNPFIHRPAPKFASLGNLPSMTIAYCDGDDYPMILPRRRIAYRFAGRCQTPGVQSYRWQLRGSDGVAAFQSADIVPTDATQEVAGIWDLSAVTVDDYRLETRCAFTGQPVAVSFYPFAAALNQVAAGVTVPNDFAFSQDAVRLASIEPNANVTADHIAAGFQGQTPLATANVIASPTPPTNAADLSLWVETDRNRLYIRLDNAWALVATINVGDSGAPSAYIQGTKSRTVTSPGPYQIGPLAVIDSNFSGALSYQWSFASNIGSAFSFVGPTNQQSATIEATLSSGELFYELQCVVSDGTDSVIVPASGGLFLG